MRRYYLKKYARKLLLAAFLIFALYSIFRSL